MARGRDKTLLGDTREPVRPEAVEGAGPLPVLTILHHPEFERIGEVADLSALRTSKTLRLSRKDLTFAKLRGGDPWPLADPFLSRAPLSISGDADRVILKRSSAEASTLEVDGTAVEAEIELDRARLARGAVVALADRVVLLLHLRARATPVEVDCGLIGESEASDRLRQSISDVAAADVPVLLLGETGTGKELVAGAIHHLSARRDGPLISVNMAAIPRELAASELFGHVSGAFTGAVQDREGLFTRAKKGTLFLDEIGATSLDVQALLLRALESGEVNTVGGGPKTTDVRCIAATDTDLREAIEARTFRAALYHRLSSYEIRVPPLRDRRDDLGRLLIHFLREELASFDTELGAIWTSEQPWLPARIAALMYRYDWRGNVRELRNCARHLAIAHRRLPQISEDERLREMLGEPSTKVIEEPARRKAGAISEAELLEALERNRWELRPTARELGLPHSSLHALIDRSAGIRKVSDIPEAELRAAELELGGDLDRLAQQLRVSRRGLQLRLRTGKK